MSASRINTLLDSIIGWKPGAIRMKNLCDDIVRTVESLKCGLHDIINSLESSQLRQVESRLESVQEAMKECAAKGQFRKYKKNELEKVMIEEKKKTEDLCKTLKIPIVEMPNMDTLDESIPNSNPATPTEKQQSVESLRTIPFDQLKVHYGGETCRIGGFARVFKGTYYGKTVAVKELTVAFSDGAHEALKKEAANLSRPPNVDGMLVGVMGLSFNNEGTPLLVMEWMENDLKRFLHELAHNDDDAEQFTEEKQLRMMIRLVMALKIVHDHKIFHRDIKSANVLIRSDGKIALSDFGLSRILDSSVSMSESQGIGGGIVGSYPWMAPEIMGSEKYTAGSDVFSLGVVLWEIATQCVPWEDVRNNEEIKRKVLTERDRLPFPPNMNPILRSLIMLCWDHDFRERPTLTVIIRVLEELLKNIEDGVEVVSNMDNFPLEAFNCFVDVMKAIGIKDEDTEKLRRTVEQDAMNGLQDSLKLMGSDNFGPKLAQLETIRPSFWLLLRMIMRGVPDSEIQASCCRILKYLGRNVHHRSDILEYKFISRIVVAMKNQIDEGYVQVEACGALANCVMKQSEKLKLGKRNRALLPTLKDVMNRQKGNPQVMLFACAALGNIVACSDNKKIIIENGFLEIVVGIMEKYSNHPGVLSKVFSVLCNLASNAEYAEMIWKFNVLPSMKNAMENISTDVNVQTNALILLVNLSTTDERSKVVEQKGFLPLVRTALKELAGNITVVEYALSVLGNLCLRSSCRQFVLKEQFMPLIKRVMSNYESNPRIQQLVCRLLKAMSGDIDVTLDEEFLPLIKTAMENHENVSTVQEEACGIIANLAFDESFLDKICDGEFIELLGLALKNHKNEVRVVINAIGALSNLATSRNGEKKSEIQNLGILNLVKKRRDGRSGALGKLREVFLKLFQN